MDDRETLRQGTTRLIETLGKLIAAESCGEGGDKLPELRSEIARQYSGLLTQASTTKKTLHTVREPGTPPSPLERDIDDLVGRIGPQHSELPTSERPIGWGLLTEFKTELAQAPILTDRQPAHVEA